MKVTETILRGVVQGKSILLDQKPGFPDGQQVTLMVQALLPPGEGIRQSAGAWADGGEELDAWLNDMQDSRQQDRQELS